jgi:hypothetical protein
MNFVREGLHLLEQASGFLTIPGGILAEAELGHLVHQFGVKEALLAGLGLEDFGLKSVDALLVECLVVEA